MRTVVYGAAEDGILAMDALRLKGIRTDFFFFCDTNPAKQHMEFAGIQTISPEELVRLNESDPVYLIISTHLYEDVLLYLQQLGCRGIGKLHIFKSRYWLESEDKAYKYNLSLIERGFLRTSAFFSYDEVHDLGNKDYFIDIFDPQKLPDINYFDIGAYDGDSIRQIEHFMRDKLTWIYAFEPQRSLIPMLETNLRKWGLSDKAMILPFALGKSHVKMQFKGTGMNFGCYDTDKDISDHNSCNTKEEISVKCLDAFDLELSGYPFIKMDVEGMELATIEGMQDFISKYTPCIAMCVYHRAYDDYVLPQYVSSLSSQYIFYIRGGFHVCCYAVPRNLHYCLKNGIYSN